MAYFDELALTIRLRDGQFVGSGSILREDRSVMPHEVADRLGNNVSLDDLYDALDDFIKQIYVDDALGRGYTIDDAPQAIAYNVESSQYSQGGDSAGVLIVIELLSNKAWDVLVGLFGAWLWEKLNRNDND